MLEIKLLKNPEIDRLPPCFIPASIWSTTPLEDGNTVSHYWVDGQHYFNKYAADGSLLWSKAMEGTEVPMEQFQQEPVIAMFKEGSDGFRVAFLKEVATVPGDTLDIFMDDDSTKYVVQCAHVSGDGVVSNGFLLSCTYGPFPSSGYTLSGLDAAPTADNGMVLALSFFEAIPATDILKLNATGEVIWAQSVGLPDPGLYGHPTSNYTNNVTRLAVAPSGRIYHTEAASYFGNYRLAELDADNGGMLWMKNYIYDPAPVPARIHDIQVDAGGNVHAAGTINTSVGYFHYLLRSNADGVLDRTDFYRSQNALLNGQFVIDAQGRRIQMVRNSMAGSIYNFSGILVADTLGSPAQFIRKDDQLVVPNNALLTLQGMDLSGGALALDGLLVNEHMDLATTTRYGFHSTLVTDELASCLMDDTTYADIPVPLDLMTTELVANAVAIDVAYKYSSVPTAFTLTDVGMDTLQTLCSFVNEILLNQVGIREEDPSLETPLVMNTLVAAGTPIFINDARASTVAVHTSGGTLVHRSNLAADRTLPTTGWAPGVYLLRAMDAQGAQLRTAKVVVE
ncbi:MAG: hypothetical protein IPN44_07815 [Flavobacteriales bacterium]|nr:hypothetical protein [Flavobacteriales bacterium]